MPVVPRGLKSRLAKRSRREGLDLGPELAERLVAYLDLLYRWNERINLTALSDPDEAVDRLVLEPLAAAKFVPGSARSLLDIGSGGGSPAVPLKLAVPRLQLRMVEAKTRKAAFLRELIRTLGLQDTDVEPLRYEELLAKPDLHEAVDLVTVRAVRVESGVFMTLQAFLPPGGRLFLFRGGSGPDVPVNLPPPLAWEATKPLVSSLRSRLVVLRKARIGRRVPSRST